MMERSVVFEGYGVGRDVHLRLVLDEFDNSAVRLEAGA